MIFYCVPMFRTVFNVPIPELLKLVNYVSINDRPARASY